MDAQQPGSDPANHNMTHVGRVLGSEDATPLEFWVAIEPDQYLQIDDVVAVERALPGGPVRHRHQIRARHEGARFDSDVFLIEDGVLPAERPVRIDQAT